MSIPNIEYQEGKVVDTDTGEVLAEPEEGFTVKDRESAEWVMKVIYEAECDIDALENRKAVLIKNMDDAIRHKSALLASFKWRWANELKQFAKQDTKKGKTWHSPYGHVKWSAKKGGLRVKDEGAAAEFARVWCAYALKITTDFQPSRLSPTDRKLIARMLSKRDRVATAAFSLTPDTETVSIKTGVQ